MAQGYDPIEPLMAALQQEGQRYAQAAPGFSYSVDPAGGVIIGGPETQDVPGQLANRVVAPAFPSADRIPIPTPRAAPVSSAPPDPAPVPTPTPAPRPDQTQMAPPPIRPAMPVPGASSAPAPAAEEQQGGLQSLLSGGGLEGLSGGKDIRSMLIDFLAGAAGSQGGGLGGIATGALAGAQSRQTREDRKKAELSAMEAARLKMDDRLYERGRDATRDSRDARKLELELKNSERNAGREDREFDLRSRKTEVEIKKMEREAAATGISFADQMKIENTVNEYAKRLTPSYGGMDADTQQKVEQYRTQLTEMAKSASGQGVLSMPEPSGTTTPAAPATVPRIKNAAGQSMVLQDGKWVPE